MTKPHPITPPPELLKEWIASYEQHSWDLEIFADLLSCIAARWGADQELEACCEWLLEHGYDLATQELHYARRPKPPSLKEKALRAYWRFQNNEHTNADEMMRDFRMIEKALEALTDD